MPIDVQARAQAELDQIEAAFAFTVLRVDRSAFTTRTFVKWAGGQARINDYAAAKLKAISDWFDKWCNELSMAGVTTTLQQDIDLIPSVILHFEPALAEEDPEDDPWKPEAEPVASSATELQRIALYKSLPPDDRW